MTKIKALRLPYPLKRTLARQATASRVRKIPRHKNDWKQKDARSLSLDRRKDTNLYWGEFNY